MELPKNIVKIIGDNNFGTGIIIDNDLIITAKHVIKQKKYKIELYNGETINAEEVKCDDNEIIGMLKLEQSVDIDIEFKMVSDYEPYEEDEWEVYGYITNQQISHYMKGKGISYIVDEEKKTDMQLCNISVGESINYKGLSGSPVIINEMIIGILQEQIISGERATDIKVSSVSSFSQYIDSKYIKENTMKKTLKQNIKLYTEHQIQKNIESGKYIPEIFVEDGEYKEYVRFFADPKLFLKKAIEEIQLLNIEDINAFLYENFKQKIRFRIPDKIEKMEEIINTTNNLIEDLYNAKKLVEDKGQLTDLLKKGHDLYYRKTKDFYNRALQFEFSDISKNLDYIKYKYLLIINKAGQGKTNFICDFTKNFLIKKDYFVLYLNAYEIDRDAYEFICNKLIGLFKNKDINYIFHIMEKDYQTTMKPFIILIDGLNENNIINNFANNIKQFLERIYNYDFIKVIMTTREEFYEEKFKEIESGIYTKQFNKITMFNNHSSFRNRIFWGYLNFFNITIRKYSLSNRTFRKLSEDTLLLRFFCESNKGKKQLYMYDIYKYKTFQKYIDKKIEELDKEKFGLGQIYINVLNKIIEYMIENKKYYNIPIDIMNSEELDLVYKLILNDIIIKEDIAIKEGFLEENKTVISFTFDEFRDFYISQYISKKYEKTKLQEFINHLNDKDNANIKEGVLKYLFFIGKNLNGELLKILRTMKDYEVIYWNNIFDIEDENIQDSDIEKIEDKFFSDEECRRIITMDLILRYDKNYFKKLNINNLYHILELFCEKEGEEFDRFINKEFRPKYEDEYMYESSEIWPYNKMLNQFKLSIKRKRKNIYELYKMTIYLMSVCTWETYEFWKIYIECMPEMAIDTLKCMNNKVPDEINENIKAITHDILQSDLKIDKSYMQEIQKIYNENKVVYEQNTVLEDFFKALIGGDI